MTKEQQFLLELMSVAIGTKDAVPLPEQPDWRVLFREAHVQTVMPLCADALAPHWSKIPADLAEKATYVAQKVTAAARRWNMPVAIWSPFWRNNSSSM